MSSWKAAVEAAFDAFERVTIDPAPPSRDDGGEGAQSIVRSSIEDPIGDIALSQRLCGLERITLVVPDALGPVSETTLRVVLEHLDAFAESDAEICALVATDWRGGPGPAAASDLAHLRLLAQHQIPVVVHDRRDARPVGVVTVDGDPIPVELHPLVLDTDLVILPEPVDLAWGSGVGGGYRSIARGVAGRATLGALDRLADALPDADRTRIDRGHALHEAWARVAAAAAPCFAIFETVTATSRAFVSGEPSMALAVLAERPGSPWYADVEVFDGLVLHVPVPAGCTALDGFAHALSLLDHRRAPLRMGAPVLLLLEGEAVWIDDDAHRAFADALQQRAPSPDGGDGVVAARTLARRLMAVARRHPLHAVGPSDLPDFGDVIQRHADALDGCEGLSIHMRALSEDAAPHAALVRDVTHRLPVASRTGVVRHRRSSG